MLCIEGGDNDIRVQELDKIKEIFQREVLWQYCLIDI